MSAADAIRTISPEPWGLGEYARVCLRRGELIFFFLMRDFRVRYRESLIGMGWALLQPLLGTAVFVIALRRWLHIPAAAGPEFPVATHIGLIAYQFLSRTVNRGGTALTANGHLLSRIYFPRLLLPAAEGLSSVPDLLVGLLSLAVWLPSGRIVLTLPGLAVSLAALVGLIGLSIGASAALSFVDSYLRDVRFLLPYFTQLALFLSPVFFSTRDIASSWAPWLRWNPLTGVIETWRWALLDRPGLDVGALVLSLAWAVALIALAFALYARKEKELGDLF